MVGGFSVAGNQHRFAATPGTKDSPDWQALDNRLPPGHLARQIDKAVEMLDLSPLFASYLGVG